MSNIAIVGGCGRLGLNLALIAANKGHNVTAIDIDDERINEIKQGNLPFVKEQAELYLEEALKNKKLTLSTEYDQVANAEVIVITMGTPVDSNLNPSLEPVAGVIFDLSEHFKKNQLIVFRNAIAPTVTNRIKTLIEDKTGFKVGKDIHLVFAPELAEENGNLHDLNKAAQPIGAFDENSFRAAQKFFDTITKGQITWLSPEEALLAKLMTNMFAYIQGACANEFYLIAQSFNANINKILDATSNALPAPNPNNAGPGMHKEGWSLVERLPFAELVTTAFKINESMPAQIVKQLENHSLKKVAILGMTNKANYDDARSSLSYKLRKMLFYKDYEVVCYDPYLPEFADSAVLQNTDAVILMTAHDEFSNLEKVKGWINNSNCVFVDIHGYWQELRNQSANQAHANESVKARKK